MYGKIAFIALIGCVAAQTTQTFPSQTFPSSQQSYQQVPLESRTGFGVNANAGYESGGLGLGGGFNTPIGDFNVNTGLRAPTFGNNNLLTGLVVFLGVLSLINIVATVVVPWFSQIGSKPSEKHGDKSIEENVETGRRYQRNINMVADYVLSGIESFANKHE